MPRKIRGRTIKQQYLSLLAKRPLKPADIHRLEVLAVLLMHEKVRNGS